LDQLHALKWLSVIGWTSSKEFASRTVKMNLLHRRIGLANSYGGGIIMTGVIFMFGYSTPSFLKWIARGLAYFP
jgi:hypothetical protein